MIMSSSCAQLITILLSPIITRLYAPEDLGVFTLYSAIASILAVFFTGQYHHAIMLQKNRDAAYQITFMCALLSFASFILLLCLSTCIWQFFDAQAVIKNLGGYIMIIPFGALFIGLYHALTSLASYEQKFKNIAGANINLSLSNNIISIFLGLNKLSQKGLIIGHFIAHVLSVLLLTKSLDLKAFKVNRLKIFALLKRYKKFPLVTLPHNLFSTASLHLPHLIIISFYNPALAGLYYLANRIAGIPISIINQALYNVIYQELCATKTLSKTYFSRLLAIGGGGIPVFLVICFFAPSAFRFLFGEEWSQAGIYVRILTPLFYFKFISNLFTTSVYFMFERQGENFLFSVVITILTIACLLYGAIVDDLILALYFMVAINIAIIFIKMSRATYFIMKDDKRAQNL